ncbi:hypothetical protein [Caballeronia sp. 15711]|uniref:hypothetical protein n=1 Tax=Caballeronia sp. 15711 TaxID=3391029 RepID=UPI0039E3D7BA
MAENWTREDLLSQALNMADCFSQEGLDAIEMICDVSLTAMLQPAFWRSTDTIATALQTIKRMASDTRNAINGEAEQLGCNYRDEKSRPRHDARQAFIDEQEVRSNKSREVNHV